MPTVSEYEAWKNRQQQSNVGKANIVLGQDYQQEPDQYAADLSFAKEASTAVGNAVPLQMVQDPDTRSVFQRIVAEKKQSTVLSSSPMLADWLRTPGNANLTRDDLEGLSWWETATGAASNAAQRGATRLPVMYNQWMAEGAAQRAGDASRSFGDIYAQERATVGVEGKLIDTAVGPITDLLSTGSRFLTSRLSAAFGGDQEKAAAYYQQQAGEITNHISTIAMSPAASKVRDEIAANEPTGNLMADVGNFLQVIGNDPAGFTAFLTETAIETAPMLAAAFGAGIVTRNPAVVAGTLGSMSGLQERYTSPVEFLRDKGVDVSTPEGAMAAITNPDLMAEAARVGALRGMIIGSLDTISGGMADEMLAKNPLLNLLLQSVVQAGFGGGGEAAAQIATGKQLNVSDVMMEALAEFVTAPIDVGSMAAAKFSEGVRAAAAAEKTTAALEEIAAQATASVTRERSPDTFRDYVATVTAGGARENIFVPAVEFNEYFQSRGIDPFELADQLAGMGRDDLQTAIETGGSVQIPTATWAADMAGSEHDAFIVQNSSFDPGAMTGTQAAEFEADKANILAEAWAEAEAVRQDAESLRQIFEQETEQLLGSLRAAGRYSDVAAEEALQLVSARRTLAERGGFTPEEFAARYPLPSVQGERPAGLDPKNVDELTRTLTEARARKSVGLDTAKTPLMEFISERGGVVDPGGELANIGAAVIKRPGKKTLKLERSGALAGMRDMLGSSADRGLDTTARAAVESGFMADDPDVLAWKEAERNGTEAPDLTGAFLRAIQAEMTGEVAAPVDNLGGIEEYLAGLGVGLEDDDATIRAAIENDRQYDAPVRVNSGGTMLSRAQQKAEERVAEINRLNPQLSTPITIEWVDGSSDPTKPNANGSHGGFKITISRNSSNPDATVIHELRHVIDSLLGMATLTRTIDFMKGDAEFDALIAYLKEARDDGRIPDDVYWIAAPSEVAAETAAGVIAAYFNDRAGLQAVAPDLVELLDGMDAGKYAAVVEPMPAAIEGSEGEGRAYGQAPVENMVVQHNLSAANLLHADKMRGLAVPSVAISNVDHPLDSFGEITLLGGPDLIDPRKDSASKVFDADVYSPRYPTVRYKIARKPFDKVWKRLDGVSAELGHVLSGEIDNSEVERKGLEAFRDSSAVQLQFLRDTGKAIDLPQQSAKTTYLTKAPEIAEFVGEYTTPYEVMQNPDAVAAIGRAIDMEVATVLDARGEGFTADEVRGWYYDKDGDIRRNVIDAIQQEIRVSKRPGVDRSAARQALREAIKPVANEFAAWVEAEFGSVLAGETIETQTASGDWKYLPHTLDNVVKVLRRKLRDGEVWNYGVASIRSNVANQFKSIAAIKAARGKLIPSDAMQALKDESNDEFSALAGMMEGFAKAKMGYGFLDAFSEHLKEVAERGVRSLDQYYDGLGDEQKQAVVAFLDKLASMPTEYFEAKIQRAVDISEFKAAVIPTTADKAVRDVLLYARVPVIEYDSSKPGARAAAIRQASGEQRLLFQADAGFQGGGARGSIQFPGSGIANGQTIISLFKTADLSTFLHESGHYFLSVMQDMASLDPTSTIAADYQVVKDWWRDNADAVATDAGNGVTADDVRAALDNGTTGDAAKDRAIDTGMQEQFARANELYMMEGKAPSPALRQAFEKFQAWLMSIYKSARGLNVNVTDELRGVFDRLLATDAEIQQARADAGTDMNLTADDLGMTAEQFASFTKLRDQAKDEAKSRTLNEAMKPIRRAASKAYQAERAKVRDRIETETKQQPVYRAIQELRFGKSFDGEEVNPLKLDRAIIEAEYGAGYIPYLPGATKDGRGHRNAVFSTEGGVHPDVVAGAYGFPTGRDLLDKLANAPDMDALIEAETNKEMEFRHNDPLKDGSIQQEAMDAVHNDLQGQVLAARLDAFNEIAGTDRGMTHKAAREAARRSLRGMAVKDATRADRFLAAERKAAAEVARLSATVTRTSMWMDAARRRVEKQARGAVRAGNAKAALSVDPSAANQSTARRNEQADALVEASRRQLLNHMLYSEARKVATETDAVIKRVSMLRKANAKLSKTRDINFVLAARAVAARFGMTKPDSEFDFKAWMDQLAYDDPVTAAAMVNTIETYSQEAKPYKDLTVAEFGAVKDAVESLLALAKTTRSIEIDGIKADRRDAIDAMIAVAEPRGKVRAGANAAPTDGEKNRLSALTAGAALVRTEAWARDMDDGKAGVFTRYLVKPVMDALGVYREARTERVAELLAIVEPRRGELLGKAVNAPEIGYTFENKGALLHALLHTGNESNKKKLLLGRGWSKGMINAKQAVTKSGAPRVDRQGNPIMDKGTLDTSAWDAMIERLIADGTITAADKKMAEQIWALMDSLKRPAQTAHKKIYGHYFNEIEAAPFTNSLGTWRGGYVPAIIDQYASIDAGKQDAAAALDSQMDASMFPTTGSGFTKGRVEYNQPLALNLQSLPGHMDKVLRFTHLEPTIRQTASLLSDRGLREAVSSVNRDAIDSILTPWLMRTARQAVEGQSTTGPGRATAKYFRAIRKRVGLHMMALNVVNAAQQITGIPSAAVLVKVKHLKAATVRFAKDAGAMRAEAIEASAMMKDRMDNSSRVTSQEIDKIITAPTTRAEVDRFVNEHGYVLQQGMQNLVDIIVWHGAYDQAVQQGMTGPDAVFEADSVVRRSQGSFNPEDISLFEAGPAFVRMFTMFTSYFNTQLNLVGGEAVTTIRTMGWQGGPRLFHLYFFGMMLPAVLAEAMAQIARGSLGDEDDDGLTDDMLDLFVGSQVKFVAGAIPGLGPLSMSMMNNFNDQTWDDQLSISPATYTLEKIAAAPATVMGAITGKGSASKATADGITALGLVLGVPTGQLAKTAGYLVKVGEGRAEPENALDVVRGLTSGRDGTE